MGQRGVDFDQVIRDHAGLIGRITRSFEANEQDREDLRQDILLALWRALPSFRGDSSLKTFVARVAQKRAISHVRRQSRRARTDPYEEGSSGVEADQEERVIENDIKKKLAAILSGLPIAQRETAVLLLEGFSYSEIASILGISANAAVLRCQRAKAYLTSVLREG
ncbi:MAG TPA: RNA polymerase sigma factor [Allosphingosinicella sp.]|nr:RNA polymerase sigma factor [Allosphingosinicella sp.]